jgi:hypothetical protein
MSVFVYFYYSASFSFFFFALLSNQLYLFSLQKSHPPTAPDFCFVWVILYRFFEGAFAKLPKAIFNIVAFVNPSGNQHETTRLPLDWFWLNLIFEIFFENISRNSTFISLTRTTDTLNEDIFTLIIIYIWILLKVWKFFWKPFVEKIRKEV